MQESLFNKQWYRVANLRPVMRASVVNYRHYYRDCIWYVITCKSSNAQIRVNQFAYYMLSQFDGEKTVDEIWQLAISTLSDDAPTQQDVIQLLISLYEATLIDFQREGDVGQLFDQYRRKQSQKSKGRYWNPLFLRFAIFDPDKLAQTLLPWFRWVFNRMALIAWITLLIISGIIAAYSWGDISQKLNLNIVSPNNLLVLWFVFPIMKLIHELAHAIAVKRWGGEVHECGISLLVLMPIPYVDASHSASFNCKYRRMAVAAAGIIVESTLACLGLFVWVLVEPGLIKDIAFNVMLTGSVSSILFNANPLLKFDAYYVLSDAIEIPSLNSRSTRYLLYLIKRYLFGMSVRSPVTAEGERMWFIAYGVISSLYRVILAFGICLFVASQYFFLGVVLAIWALMKQLGLPIIRAIKFLLTDPALGQQRIKANVITIMIISVMLVSMVVIPIPHSTQARGVIWPQNESIVRAGENCFVKDIIVDNGQQVSQGNDLIRCDVRLLQTEVTSLRAEQRAARAAMFAAKDRVEREIKKSDLKLATSLLYKSQEKLKKTIINSPTHGIVFVPNAENIKGRFLQKGELVGYVLDDKKLSIRTMLQQENIDLLNKRLESVEVRLLRQPQMSFVSDILRTVPSASKRLVSPVLGIKGGGDLLLAAEDNDGMRLQDAAFELELVLPDKITNSLVGEAVVVRFSHGSASIVSMLYRQLQLLLLRRFNV
ncbi:MAG: hypothetical protein AB8B89_10560 [Gammaproteobacteria bacterium]